jgi:nucleoside-diphosphate-sugar epimerase
MMKAFLTGGSGFVGKRMLTMLLERGYTVNALARSDRAVRQVQALGAIAIHGDLLDEQAMLLGMQGCDVVFHVAGYIKMWGKYKDFYEANVVGTEIALAAAQNAGIQRFVQVGASAVVMNKGTILNGDETLPLQHPAFSPYIATKSIAEERVIAANTEHFVTSVVRPSWIWGGVEDHSLVALIKAVKNHRFMWINQGNYPFVTTHVANVCHGAILASQHSLGGQSYFLADANIVQFRTWVIQLLATQGIRFRSISVPREFAWTSAQLMEWIWQVMRLRGEPPMSRTTVRMIGQGFTFSDHKARQELGYRPIVSREQGLAELVQPHKATGTNRQH